jgi:hypothetical protein
MAKRSSQTDYTSALARLANDLAADISTVNQAVGQRILGCLHCNLSAVGRRCDTCPLLEARFEQASAPLLAPFYAMAA